MKYKHLSILEREKLQELDEEMAKVEYILNTRPRKRLGWSTPLQVMSVALQS